MQRKQLPKTCAVSCVHSLSSPFATWGCDALWPSDGDGIVVLVYILFVASQTEFKIGPWKFNNLIL